MGYKIEYATQIVKKPLKNTPAVPQWTLTLCFFILFLICSHLFWPEALATLRDLLVPRGEAVSVFLSELRNGTDFTEAVEAFCQQLVSNG